MDFQETIAGHELANILQTDKQQQKWIIETLWVL